MRALRLASLAARHKWRWRDARDLRVGRYVLVALDEEGDPQVAFVGMAQAADVERQNAENVFIYADVTGVALLDIPASVLPVADAPAADAPAEEEE